MKRMSVISTLVLLVLPAIAAPDFRKMSFLELMDLPYTQFYDLRPAGMPEKLTLRLSKVDEHNRKVGTTSPLFINYEAYRETVRREDETDDRELLSFKFPGLSPEQFEVAKNLFGGVSKIQPKPGRNDYTLLDLMPPLIQALEGKAFIGEGQDLDILNETTTGRRSLGSSDIRAQLHTSCWATAYELHRHKSFVKGSPVPTSFSAFVIDGNTVEESFRKRAKRVFAKNFKAANGSIKLDGAALGDLILIKPIHRAEDGRLVPVLEHVVVAIDGDLVFEKANPDPIDPYRFVGLNDSAARFYDREGFDVVGVRIEVLRVTSALRPPREEFAGYANAQQEMYKQPLIGRLNQLLLLSKEIYGAGSTEFYNSFGLIVDVGLEVDPKTGRAVLSKAAYDKDTFDFARLIQKYSK